jgi:hypothetical protein
MGPKPTVRVISISDIDVDLEWNIRNPVDVNASSEGEFASAGLEGLIANLRANGQTTPVDVRSTTTPFYRDTGGKPYSLVTGFRRVTALSAIYAAGGLVPGLLSGQVSAIHHGSLGEREAFMLNARENTNRESLSPPDMCFLIKRGLDHGVSKDDLALQLGLTPWIVTNYGRIAALPDIFAHWRCGGSFRGSLSQKRVSVGEMIEIARAPDPAEAYRQAIGRRASREVRGPKRERARARAEATGTQLAKLVKRGLFTLPPRVEWTKYIDIVAGVEPRFPDAKLLAIAAQEAFEAEMARKDSFEE